MEDGYTLRMIMKDLDCPLDPVLEICEFAVGDKEFEDMSVASYEVMRRNHIDFGGLIEEGLAATEYDSFLDKDVTRDQLLVFNDKAIKGIKELETPFEDIVEDARVGGNISMKITAKLQKQLEKNGIKLVPNGFAINNEVYLNKDTMNGSTPIHEFNHLYMGGLKQNRPEAYKKGLDLVEAELGKTNSEIQDVIDYVKTTQPNLEGEALSEEILTLSLPFSW